MKISDYSLIKKEWLDEKVKEFSFLALEHPKDSIMYAAYCTIAESYKEVKRKQLSTMPLCEKVFDEGYLLGLSGTPKDTNLFNTCRGLALISDIKIDDK